MHKKGNAALVLIILAVVVVGALWFGGFNKEGKISVPENYVELAESSANEAKFVFAVPVEKSGFVGANIRHCVISVSAGSADSSPVCKDMMPDNGFSLAYDEATRTLTVSDPTPGEWGAQNGPFRIGCAACASAVEFSGLRTTGGQLLPKKMVVVY